MNALPTPEGYSASHEIQPQCEHVRYGVQTDVAMSMWPSQQLKASLSCKRWACASELLHRMPEDAEGHHLCRAMSVQTWAQNLATVCSALAVFRDDTRTSSRASAGTTYHQDACSADLHRMLPACKGCS